ncbi:HTH-type transcriptional regulator YodB [Streptomyces sp. MBT84]|uniref:winged helix-turn-helix transcriptional regulator n=1 Tax=unclassified Streptomyces TaxID=2593676 RepID=UPI001DEA6827|nr:helix-turn-helix domain-containing protein [Streptomyces sp. MBT84]MBW8705757.1 HTH-type transcriptional regulator YodB [Streptomyces sp. MBT84]
MKRREFGQYCGLARALELVGERWTLLIVRELLARPCRFTDLLDNLPGIPSNVLSSRLKELEGAQIVERRIAPAPHRGVVYAITEDGRELEPAVLSLARWGNRHLGERNGEIVPASTLVLSLRAMFNRQAAAGVTATWEIRAADAVLNAVVTDGTLTASGGSAPTAPDLVITISAKEDEVPTFRDIITALRDETAQVTGRPELLSTFLQVFAPPAA